MKKLFFLALVAIVAISGCKKDEVTQPSYTADVTIGGVKTTFTLMKYLDATSGSTTTYEIENYGSESETKYIIITLVNPAIGDMNFSTGNNLYITIDSKSYSSKTGAGKVTISSKDAKTISGTFSGTFLNANTEIQITGNFSSEQLSLTL